MSVDGIVANRAFAARNLHVVCFLAAIVFPGAVFSGSLRFDRPVYDVVPGESFNVQVFLDMDDAVPGNQPPTSGFLSMGTRVLFDQALAQVTNVNDITVVPELDSDGLGGPAGKEAEPGNAGAFGVLPFGAPNAYFGTLLVTITIENLAARGTYTLTPAFFNNPPVVNFVDNLVGSLDSAITNFVTSVVRVASGVRITEVNPLGGDQIAIHFTDAGGAASGWQLECANSIIGDPDWTETEPAILSTNAPGTFQWTVEVGGRTGSFFRVKTLL